MAPWANWKPYPHRAQGRRIDAPDGPGVFEVRHMETGEQVAFAAAPDVAQGLAKLIAPPASGLRSFFVRRPTAYRSDELEYRTLATATVGEARSVTKRLNGQRKAYLSKRQAGG